MRSRSSSRDRGSPPLKRRKKRRSSPVSSYDSRSMSKSPSPRERRRRSSRSPRRSPRRKSSPRRDRRLEDASPPRRDRRREDASPPRRDRRREDASPPRRDRRREDASPPRRPRKSSTEEQDRPKRGGRWDVRGHESTDDRRRDRDRDRNHTRRGATPERRERRGGRWDVPGPSRKIEKADADAGAPKMYTPGDDADDPVFRRQLQRARERREQDPQPNAPPEMFLPGAGGASSGPADSGRGGRGGNGGGRGAGGGAGREDKKEGKDDKDEDKQGPDFGLSGALTKDVASNQATGQTKYCEPPEARMPNKKWRLYVLKGGDVMNEEPLRVYRKSCFMFGRDPKSADILALHPSISKYHAVLQYRVVKIESSSGDVRKVIKPYLIDLESRNATFLNDEKIEPAQYYELKEKDFFRLGNSTREYMLLHEESKA